MSLRVNFKTKRGPRNAWLVSDYRSGEDHISAGSERSLRGLVRTVFGESATIHPVDGWGMIEIDGQEVGRAELMSVFR